MKITEQVHQIRIDFQVTEKVNRFVYIYLITGESCYLIDSGVAGSEKIIEEYMQSIGREITEIKGVFLTHAHPDHMGSAAAIRRMTDCKIYSSEAERRWIENIDVQFQERPIPGFYRLAGESVKVDGIVRDGDRICPEEGIVIEAMDTAGHSKGDVSYLLNGRVLFTGDAIPAAEDLPIIINLKKSIVTLNRIAASNGEIFCPAWDLVYDKNVIEDITEKRKEMLLDLQKTVGQIDREFSELSAQEKTEKAADLMGWDRRAVNPLFARSIRACRECSGFIFGF